MAEAEVGGFEQFAIVEIMGHHTYAGFVSDQAIGGHSFVRVDVPAVDGREAFTKMFGASSIYCITPVSEEVCRAAARSIHQKPISVYMPELYPPAEPREIGRYIDPDGADDYDRKVDDDDQDCDQ